MIANILQSLSKDDCYNHFMRTIKRNVASAFIFSKDNQLLLGQHLNGGVYEGAWAVPGGGIEVGETKRQAMEREILEESGLELREAEVQELEEVMYGESTKTLRDSNETVLAKMNFYDFVVRLPQNAEEVVVESLDDLENIKFFTMDECAEIELAAGTKNRLVSLGYLSMR